MWEWCLSFGCLTLGERSIYHGWEGMYKYACTLVSYSVQETGNGTEICGLIELLNSECNQSKILVSHMIFGFSLSVYLNNDEKGH
jgi:hypothetical protein